MGAVKELVIAHGAQATRQMLAKGATQTQPQTPAVPLVPAPPVVPLYFSARWSDEAGRWLVQKRQGSPRQSGWDDGIDPNKDAVLSDVEGLPAAGRTMPWPLLGRIVRHHAKENLPLRVWHNGGWCNGG